MKFKIILPALVLGSILTQNSSAEPAYCDPAQFNSYAVTYQGKSPNRMHVYKIGRLTLAGMGVGNSNATDVRRVAEHFSPANSSDKFCTWYLNDGNDEAADLFDWHPLPKPSGTNYQKTADTYMSRVGNEFDQASVNFVSCAADRGYIAMGCDGMRHRGPSVFAMFLSYAGCTPEHATAIVNRIWGENGIKPEMRIALAKRAAALADQHQEKAQLLRTLMGGK